MKEFRYNQMQETLNDIPFDEDNEGELTISQDFHIFEKGTTKNEIWHWFDEKHPKGVDCLFCV